MIRIATPVQRLRADERFGLEVLIDLTRLLPVDDPAADVVRLELDDTPGAGEDFRAFLAGRVPVATGEGELRLPRWTLRHVTAVAGAEVEQRSPERDRFDRVPAAANPLVGARRERHPVVSQLACDLRAAALRAAGRRAVRCLPPWPDGHRWAVALTHDLDVVAGWPAFAALRVLELVGKGKLGLAARSVGAALGAVGRDPVWSGVQEVLAAEGKVPATWFVLSATPSWQTWRLGDVTYSVESREARRILDAARAADHEIGLHGSYFTMLDAGRFRAEGERLASVAGVPPRGVRQHFLRMRPGGTQHAMLAAGFEYDATYGFADRNGFRLGVADVVPAWDAAHQTSGGLDEVPLVWMDRALTKYGRVEDPEVWITDAVELAQAAQDVDGLWVGLWHPNQTAALGYPSAPQAYVRLVRLLLERRPFVATLGAAVEWRRARRAVRASRVAPDSRVELVADTPSRWPLALEDGQGRAVETRPWPVRG
ncbi:MAG: hypothetical protein AUG10_00140 [Gemmatimonadetes bacterium 13_1_20CM_2_70_10]|nr:MAG: hypothetical protein AUG10_00140 [Gemmatimonadetes bacterium 13_1_20CM_2_70_10]